MIPCTKMIYFEHVWGPIHTTLEEWMKTGPGLRYGHAPHRLYCEEDKRDLPLSMIPIQYRNYAISDFLIGVGLFDYPWKYIEESNVAQLPPKFTLKPPNSQKIDVRNGEVNYLFGRINVRVQYSQNWFVSPCSFRGRGDYGHQIIFLSSDKLVNVPHDVVLLPQDVTDFVVLVQLIRLRPYRNDVKYQNLSQYPDDEFAMIREEKTISLDSYHAHLVTFALKQHPLSLAIMNIGVNVFYENETEAREVHDIDIFALCRKGNEKEMTLQLTKIVNSITYSLNESDMV